MLGKRVRGFVMWMGAAGALVAASALLPGLTAARAEGDSDRTEFVIEADTPLVLGELLRQVTLATGIRLQYDPSNKIIQRASIEGARVRLSGSRDQVVDQLRRLLVQHDLVVSLLGPPMGHQYQVDDVKAGHAAFRLRPEYVSINASNVEALEAQAGRFVTTWIPVSHLADLKNARAALQRIVTQGNLGNITEVPQVGGFVVTDFAPNVASVFRLLVAMDRSSPSTTTTAGPTVALPVRHARAVDMVAVLQAHYAEDRPDGPRPPTSDASTARAPRITADARTNTVLVTGPEEDIQAVRAALALLDVNVPGATGARAAARPAAQVAIVRLEHAKADDAANRVLQLLQQTRSAWQGEVPPGVVADTRTNSVLLSGDADALGRLREIIALLDVPAATPR